jgi:hypothetical protein
MLEIVLILAITIAAAYSNHRIGMRWDMPKAVKVQLHALLVYHLIYTWIFILYIQHHGGDATAYWTLSTNVMPGPSERWMDYFGLSTFFVQWLNFMPYKVWGFSFVTGNFLWGMLGFFGIRFLFLLSYDGFIKEVPTAKQVICLLIFFQPNLHFWTAGIGKEALTLFALSWMLWGLTYLRRHGWQAIPAWGILFLIRPHIGFLAIGLVLVVWLFSPLFANKIKIAVVVGLGGLLLLTLPLLVTYLNIPDFSPSSLRSLMDYQIDFLQHGGSSVDLASYNQAERLFTYLFRPLFYDAFHWQSLLASIENLVYLIGIILFFIYWRWEAVRKMPWFISFGLLFFLITTLLFANSLSNLGIMMRMKSFTLIFLLIGALYLLTASKWRRQEIDN